MPVLISDWNVVPASNVTVDGVNINEACPPAGLNNAIRSVMSGVRTFYDAQQTTNGTIGSAMLATGGAFTGTQPIYTGQGAFLHNQANGMASGKVFLQAAGGAAPTMAPGDWLLEY